MQEEKIPKNAESLVTLAWFLRSMWVSFELHAMAARKNSNLKFRFQSSLPILLELSEVLDQPADHFENFKFNKFQSAISYCPHPFQFEDARFQEFRFDISDNGHYRQETDPLNWQCHGRMATNTVWTSRWTRHSKRVSSLRVSSLRLLAKWSIVTRPFTVFRWKDCDFNAFEVIARTVLTHCFFFVSSGV